eukprot:COSAG06_NODE_14409_length_1159_cov_1.638679_3_plen_158_part_00
MLTTYSVQLQLPPTEEDTQRSITVVVPLVEAAPRHRSDAPCFHSYDATTDSYVLRTLRPLGCGEEVTVCRGRGGDASLLLGESGASNADAEVCSPKEPTRCVFFSSKPPSAFAETSCSGRQSQPSNPNTGRFSVLHYHETGEGGRKYLPAGGESIGF